MLKRVICVAAVGGLLLGVADPEKYTIREHLTVGETHAYSMKGEDVWNITTTEAGRTTHDKESVIREIKAAMTVVAMKDGLPQALRLDIDAGCGSTYTNQQGVRKIPSSLAGKSVTIQREKDGSVSNDFKGQMAPYDKGWLEDCLTPNAIWFPDSPMAVGDEWDASDKVFPISKLAKGDTLTAKCQLDGVRVIAGKRIAQIDVDMTVIRYSSGNVETHVRYSGTHMVDLDLGLIIRMDGNESYTLSTPQHEAKQVSGGGSASVHEVMTGYEGDEFTPATRPSDDDE